MSESSDSRSNQGEVKMTEESSESFLGSATEGSTARTEAPASCPLTEDELGVLEAAVLNMGNSIPSDTWHRIRTKLAAFGPPAPSPEDEFGRGYLRGFRAAVVAACKTCCGTGWIQGSHEIRAPWKRCPACTAK